MSILELVNQSAFERGKAEGLSQATSIQLGETGYGSGHHAVIVLTGKSKTAVRKQAKAMNYRIEGDRPGQIYAYGCEVIRYMKDDSGTWAAICISSTYWDV